MAVELSALTKSRLADVFANGSDSEIAGSLLRNECGENLPLWSDTSSSGLDRVRLAAIKISRGSVPRLRDAVELAKTDWRDVLVAAGFSEDVMAHVNWRP